MSFTKRMCTAFKNIQSMRSDAAQPSVHRHERDCLISHQFFIPLPLLSLTILREARKE